MLTEKWLIKINDCSCTEQILRKDTSKSNQFSEIMG